MRRWLSMRNPHHIKGLRNTSACVGLRTSATVWYGTLAVLLLSPQTPTGGPHECAKHRSLGSTQENATCSASELACFRPMLRFPRLSLRLIIAYAFVGALLASSVQTDADELRTYHNNTAGYSVSYPTNW